MGFQSSNVVIPLSNGFNASPSVHCFASARGTADYHLVSGASASEANRGRRCARLSDDGMTTRKSVTTWTNMQILRTTRTKAVFSLESEGFLFDKTKRNLSEAPRGGLASAGPRRRVAQQQRGIQYNYHAAGVVYQRADDRVNHRGHCEDDRHEVQRHGEGEVALYREHHPL